MKRQQQSPTSKPDHEFGNEADVERITGRKRSTLRKDRLFGRGFPFYRFNGQVLYDLEEVRSMVRARAVDTRGRAVA